MSSRGRTGSRRRRAEHHELLLANAAQQLPQLEAMHARQQGWRA
jgi:hypothetical protein